MDEIHSGGCTKNKTIAIQEERERERETMG
jgi:hypothetical protein